VSMVPGHSRAPRSAVVVPHAANWAQRLVARFVFVLEQVLTATLRFRWKYESGLFDGPPSQPVIFCVWHNRLALSMVMYRKGAKRAQPERRLAAMVSASKDGALLARILENFGVEPVRGSTSRRGPQALLELTSWAEQGYDLAITPDGPRGPRYVIQEGVVALAQLTGLPIIPVTCYTRWKICARSWDRFQIPLPFAHCHVVFGKPIRIPRELSDEERAARRLELEQQMRTNSRD
jgi:lysophospholipid acyltransferase (LPLAT)-like uncharacterized protein